MFITCNVYGVNYCAEALSTEPRVLRKPPGMGERVPVAAYRLLQYRGSDHARPGAMRRGYAVEASTPG